MKYIFLDIDGTLLSHTASGVPESALNALKIAKQNGHKIFLCTGRSLAQAKSFLNYDVDGFVFCAGSVVYANGKRVFEKIFIQDDIDSLINKFNMLGIGYCLDGDAGAYMDSIGKQQMKKHFGGSKDSESVLEKMLLEGGFFDLDQRDVRDNIGKVCMYGEDFEKFEQFSELVKDQYSVTYTVVNHEASLYCAEITYLNINKSSGMKIVLDLFNEDYSNTVGIGDSSNDVEMLKDANIGVAMGNAQQIAKDSADFVTTDILDDGIYNAFKKIGII